MAEVADDWDTGAACAQQVFAGLADRTGMTPAQVEAHARECCRQVEVHPNARRVATERRRPQALVTVNPDLFSELVVPALGLDAVFDVIVASHAEGTAHKRDLCQIALDRLGYDGDRSAALLIDNRADLVEGWRDAGGSGYWFQGDAPFARDVPRLFG